MAPVTYSTSLAMGVLNDTNSNYAFPVEARMVRVDTMYLLSALLQAGAQAEMVAAWLLDRVDMGAAISAITVGQRYDRLLAANYSDLASATMRHGYFAAQAQLRWLPENLGVPRKFMAAFRTSPSTAALGTGGQITIDLMGSAQAAQRCLAAWGKKRTDSVVGVRAANLRALAALEGSTRMVLGYYGAGGGAALSERLMRQVGDVYSAAGGPVEEIHRWAAPTAAISTSLLQFGAGVAARWLAT